MHVDLCIQKRTRRELLMFYLRHAPPSVKSELLQRARAIPAPAASRQRSSVAFMLTNREVNVLLQTFSILQAKRYVTAILAHYARTTWLPIRYVHRVVTQQPISIVSGFCHLYDEKQDRGNRYALYTVTETAAGFIEAHLYTPSVAIYRT